MNRSREQRVRDLFQSIERGEAGDALRAYYDADAVQIEHPSLFRPSGGTRDLAGMLEGAELGARLIAQQSYEDITTITDGDTVAARFTWRGQTLAGVGPIPGGSELVAHIAAFFEFRGDRIVRQESFDCYEPLSPS